jgi:SEC-C motif-containing protein
MRSRYTAYAVGDVAYLMATTAPASPWARADRGSWRAELVAWCRDTRFCGLTVHDHDTQGDTGTVHFSARLTQGDRDLSFSERSRFVRRDGRWWYLDGQVAPLA